MNADVHYVAPWMFIPKEADLKQMLELSTTTLFGVPVKQTWTGLWMLEKFLTEQRFDLIIELGTGSGALTTFFSYHADTWSFDVEDERKLKGKYHFRQYDIFDSSTQNFISRRSVHLRTLFFCDNGDKVREAETYGPLVKRGDFMLVHDYQGLKGIKPSQIPDYLDTYRQDEWDKLGTYILCLRKK